MSSNYENYKRQHDEEMPERLKHKSIEEITEMIRVHDEIFKNDLNEVNLYIRSVMVRILRDKKLKKLL